MWTMLYLRPLNTTQGLSHVTAMVVFRVSKEFCDPTCQVMCFACFFYYTIPVHCMSHINCQTNLSAQILPFHRSTSRLAATPHPPHPSNKPPIFHSEFHLFLINKNSKQSDTAAHSVMYCFITFDYLHKLNSISHRFIWCGAGAWWQKVTNEAVSN